MSGEVRLRDVEPDDLPIFYAQQLDGDATRMAAFPARDRAAFDAIRRQTSSATRRQ